jgi:3'-phosphoadenosine 5'-phosphosulfate sulfotransferase (PAPS reductase)/FAD synthetase
MSEYEDLVYRQALAQGMRDNESVESFKVRKAQEARIKQLRAAPIENPEHLGVMDYYGHSGD